MTQLVRNIPEASLVRYSGEEVRVVETTSSLTNPFPLFMFLIQPELLIPNEKVNGNDQKN